MRVICEGVTKIYPTRLGPVVALRDITFATAESQFVCIVGPSGCGKTTLLKVVAGLTDPSGGGVRYEGPRRQAPLNAMVFQDDSIFPWMSVRDNVAFSLEVRGIPLRQRRERATELLEGVGLRRFALSYPHELSMGMRQRVGILRALACNPEVLLMDEPLAALDAQMKSLLQEELVTLWTRHERTVLYVTHDIQEAIFLGDRVLVMSRGPGRIIADVAVPLPRPREPAMRSSSNFVALQEQIWLLIRDEVTQILQSEGARQTGVA